MDGKEYITLINFNCLRILCRDEKVPFEKLDAFLASNPFESIPKLIYYGVLNHRLRNNTKGKLMDFEQFCALSMDQEGLFEQMSEWVGEALGGPEDEAEQKKTRAQRRKA